MKRLKYIAFTVLLASFSLQSCDLERYPLTDLSEDNFWTDDKNAELALTSLYRASNPQLSSSASFLRLNVLSSLN